MVSSKKSKDLLNIFKPELDELNSENNDYINIYQYIDEGMNVIPSKDTTKLWYRTKIVTDVINLLTSTRYFSDSVISIHGPQGCGKTDILYGIITFIGNLFDTIIFIDDPDKFTLTPEKYSEFSANIKRKLNTIKEKNKQSSTSKILFIIDNYGNSLRHDPTDIDRTTHSPFDQIILDFQNVTTLVCISDNHLPKYKNHIFKDKFIPYSIPELTTDQIKNILISRIQDNKSLGNNFIEIAEKLMDLSFFVKKPSIKSYLKILTLSRINFLENIQDTKKIVDYKSVIIEPKEVSLHNFYKSLSVFSDYSFKEIKNTSEFDFSRENILKEIDKQIILSDYNKNYLTNVVARKTLKIVNEKSAIATIMAIGPTGTGKTLFGHILAKICYGDSNKIVRINMNELSSSHHVNKILGSAPGYVGYKEGTPLTQGLEAKYPCVVLFDEIEKAHTDVLNSLLTMLDDGYFTDGSGVKYDLTQCILIMTSNALAMDFVKNKAGQVGFDDTTGDELKEDQSKYIEKINMYKTKIINNGFSPEFINRIDGFLLFPALDNTQLRQICKLQLDELHNYFPKINLNLEIDKIIDYLIENINIKEGGRSSKKIIKNIIIPSIIDKILNNKELQEINFTDKDINKTYI